MNTPAQTRTNILTHIHTTQQRQTITWTHIHTHAHTHTHTHTHNTTTTDYHQQRVHYLRFELRRIHPGTSTCARHDLFTYGTWLIHIWDMTRTYMGHDSFIYGTWLAHIWDMTRSYMRHDVFLHKIVLICTFKMTHLHERETWVAPRVCENSLFANHSVSWLVVILSVYMGYDWFVNGTWCVHILHLFTQVLFWHITLWVS